MGGPITGQRGAFPQPGRWGRSDTGNFSELVFHGTKEEVTAMAANFAQQLGLTYEVEENYGTFKAAFRLPWNFTANNAETDSVTVWEMFANHSEKDLLECRLELAATVGTLSQAQVQRIRYLLDSPITTPSDLKVPDPADPTKTITESVSVPVTPLVDWFAGLPLDPAPILGGNAPNALMLYQLMMQGVRSHPIEQPILRRTLVTSQRYAVAMALSNVRKIISTPSLVSLEEVPTDSLFYDPGSGQLLLPDEISADATRSYGWLKMFPTVQQIAFLKWQIVQEWQYGLWANQIWGQPL